MSQEEASKNVTDVTAESSNRTAWGRPFRKGQSGNPGGRPKVQHVTEAIRHALEANDGALAHQIAANVLEMSLQRKKGLGLAAAKEVKEWTEGKAVQAHKIEATVDESTARRLSELVEKLVTASSK